MEKDAFYFPHFSNARLDRKIKRVRKELGLEGYGIYFMILETLRDQENFSFPVEDIDLLADEFGTSEQKIRAVISNYDLFCLDDNEHFFSPKLLVFLQPYLEGKEKRRIGGIKGNLIRYKHITKDEAKDLNDAQILDIHNSITFKSAFKDLPIAKGSLTESLTDRSSSQIQYNTTQVNTTKLNTTKLNTKKDTKHKYGEYKKVLLTDKQYSELLESWGELELLRMITLLDESMEMNPKYKYSNFKIALTKWKNNSFNRQPTKSDKWKGEQNFDF